MTDQQAPKKRGRKKGDGLGIKTGPRPGSRVWQIANLRPGDSMLLEAPLGRLQPFMQQVNSDILRAGMQGKVTQATILGVELKTRQVYEIVRLTRHEGT